MYIDLVIITSLALVSKLVFLWGLGITKYDFKVYAVMYSQFNYIFFCFFYFPVGKTEAYPLLVTRRPGGSLMSPVVLFSLISQIIVQTIVQVGGFYYVQSQPW